MASHSVVDGDHEPERAQGGAPENGDGAANEPECASIDHVAGEGSPCACEMRIQASSPEWQPMRETIREMLKNKEMVTEAIRLIRVLGLYFIVALGLIAITVIIIMTKSPAELKWTLSIGSSVLITLGSWFISKRRALKKPKKS